MERQLLRHPQTPGSTRDITTTPAGPCRCGGSTAKSSTWAIHIHELGSGRAGTVCGVQIASDLGYLSFVVTCRITTEGPDIGTGRSTLGATETADMDEPIGYAVRRGAQWIVVFGWSMGAAIALQLAAGPRHDGFITALVLGSPVLDWTKSTKADCARHVLPGSARLLAIPRLSAGPLASMVGLPSQSRSASSTGSLAPSSPHPR